MTIRRILTVGFALVFLLVNIDSSLSQSYVPAAFDPTPYDWPVSTAEDQGLKTSIFEQALKCADSLPYFFSLLAVRNGYLIAEGYFHGETVNDANHIHSASKSFLSALVGIALREGYLQNLDQKMMDFFPEYTNSIQDPRKFDITLKHLLTMRAGFDWYDSEQNWQEYGSSPNWVEYVLGLPLRDNPGERMNYSTVQTNMLSVIITRASGMSTKEFAEKYLLDPLDITIRFWYRDPQGYYTGGHAMHYSPRDMARFGFLYLNQGAIDGVQIVPSEWVQESWNDYGYDDPWNWGGLTNMGYGYQWWMGNIAGYDVFYASGKGGQKIMDIPELNMVVVTTTEAEAWSDAGEKILSALNLVAHYILLPIKGVLGPAPYSPMNLSVEQVENRAFLYTETINILRWQPNPENATENIVNYRIYRLTKTDMIHHVDVDANITEYLHRNAGAYNVYGYAVSAVTQDERESGTVVISFR